MKTNTEKKEKIRARLHTTISSETEDNLNKYASLEDNEGKKIYGNKSKVIEKALDLLDKYHHPEKEDEQAIWNRAKNELKMLLVGKPTFIAYISGNYKQAYEDNIAIDIIEWYTQKSIEDLSIEAIYDLHKLSCVGFFHHTMAIFGLLLACHYNTYIDISQA